MYIFLNQEDFWIMQNSCLILKIHGRFVEVLHSLDRTFVMGVLNFITMINHFWFCIQFGEVLFSDLWKFPVIFDSFFYYWCGKCTKKSTKRLLPEDPTRFLLSKKYIHA